MPEIFKAPAVWNDPEMSDENERAFYRDFLERYNASEDGKKCEHLAKRLMIFSAWNLPVSIIERLCGTIYNLEDICLKEMTDWREKVIFADLRDAFPNCRLVIETGRNAKVSVNDVIVRISGNQIYRVIFQESVNDQNFSFLIDI
jgi:hypothetical protein